MDIKVITRHAPSNYGSLLQSIATIRMVESLGHSCQIIDYLREDESGLNVILTPLKQKGEWNNSLIKRLLYIVLRYPGEYLASGKFAKMRANYLKLTRRCKTIEELDSLRADIFMTGSDQVWGPTLNGRYDEAYFLSFVGEGAKKVSYAASFGRTDFKRDIISAYKELFSTYDAIAVRESSAVETLDDMGVPCLGQVLDPTLLLNGDEWSEYIDKQIAGRYVLVYQLHNNSDLCSYAKQFAQRVGLPLLRISPSLHQFNRGGKFIYLPSMGDFLSYIKGCTYFITDSFHGTAFALNFNRQFVEILPNNSTGSRNLSILKLTGLEDRIVRDYTDFSIADRMIDYAPVNHILERERLKSISILKTLCNI